MEAIEREIERFYNKDGIVVRKTYLSDIGYLKNHLRSSDIDEIWASHHLTPKDALRKGYEDSVFCFTVLNGRPIAIFGLVPETLVGEKASIWLLATNDLTKIQMRFLRHCKYFIDMMLDYFPYLYNHVDDRNIKSINWLRYCGAHIEEPKPHGIDNRPFRYFYFKRRR